ncbi:uncharacterized protein IWZ02DRAFT_89183 [Phyllosticta citriasiana]|uniref:uncharacterized protein n=1 Tax=Phyllosticta citriasiana TaxID=595635 RepID=UPI0030FD8660
MSRTWEQSLSSTVLPHLVLGAVVREHNCDLLRGSSHWPSHPRLGSSRGPVHLGSSHSAARLRLGSSRPITTAATFMEQSFTRYRSRAQGAVINCNG